MSLAVAIPLLLIASTSGPELAALASYPPDVFQCSSLEERFSAAEVPVNVSEEAFTESERASEAPFSAPEAPPGPLCSGAAALSNPDCATPAPSDVPSQRGVPKDKRSPLLTEDPTDGATLVGAASAPDGHLLGPATAYHRPPLPPPRRR